MTNEEASVIIETLKSRVQSSAFTVRHIAQSTRDTGALVACPP